MARILIAWELGGGLGHLAKLLPIANALSDRGHSVLFAVRDVEAAGGVLRRYRRSVIQAPISNSRGARRGPAASYGQLLANCCFGDAENLAARLNAWHSLIRLSKCDAMIFEHAPTALAATFGSTLPRIVTGTGFTCPSPTARLPRLREDSGEYDLESIESRVLATVNKALSTLRQPRLRFLADLYYSCADVQLRTFRELDPFPRKPKTRYWGCRDDFRGTPIHWPTGRGGKRIFAYLKKSPCLPKLLAHLQTSNHAAVVHGNWVTPRLIQQFNSPSLNLVRKAVDLEQVATESDAAILNATHGATARFLLAGTPVFSLPLVQEQVMTASRVRQLGAGEIADHRKVPDVCAGFDRFLADESFTTAAARFASRYPKPVRDSDFKESVDRIEATLAP